MTEADVLLLRPRGRSTDGRIFAMEQLGLAYIAAAAREAGLTAHIVDGALEPDRYRATLEAIHNNDHYLIGYPIYPETVRSVARDVKHLRSRGISTHITVGNHLATLHDTTVLTDFPQFDSAIRGEGEHTVTDLVTSLRLGTDLSEIKGLTYRTVDGIQRNPARPNHADLDSLPFPARDTLKLVLEAGNAPLIYSSRGCNARCDFCSVHNYFNAAPDGAWRARSAVDVVDEMEGLHRRYGVRDFAFADEQFLGHGRTGNLRALAIADEILRRGLDVRWYIETRASGVTREVFSHLRRSGLSAVFMGLESGDDTALRELRKGLTIERSMHAIEILKDLEILPSAGFIMYRPTTTIDELLHNLDFIEEAGCVELTALVTIIRVYSGTDLEARLTAEGRLHGTYYNYEWSFQDNKVRDCYSIAQQSADTLTVAYNAFARFRRKGLVSYTECLKLQQTMNRRPIQIMREIVAAVAHDGEATADTRDRARKAFILACEDFLRILRFVESAAVHRHDQAGVRLLSPMYLC